MKLGFSQSEIIPTATNLGLPTKGFVQRQRRVAHAYDLVSNKVMEIDDGIFRVRSQYEPQKSYIVNINRGHPSCDCPDGQRTINCKHRIASLLYLRQEIDALTIHALERSEGTDETHKSCNQRGRWIVTDDQNKVVYHIYRDINGNLICPCGRKSDCKHRKAIKEYISKNKIKNECLSASAQAGGTEFAVEIQAKLNRHLNLLKHSGKGSKDPSQRQLSLDNPVGNTNGVKAGKLRQDNPNHYNRTEWLTIYNACKDDNDDDGGAKPPSSNNDDVVKSRSIGANGKEKFRECREIALNDTRFNWIKTDLMRENALRKAYPKYWTDQDFDLLKRACALDTSLLNLKIGEHWVIQKEANFNDWDYSRRYRFWIITKDTQELREKCFYCGKTKGQVSQLYDDLIYWERYHIKTVICSDCLKTTKEDMTRRFDQLYHQSPGAVRTKGLPKPSEKFLQDLRDKLAQVEIFRKRFNHREHGEHRESQSFLPPLWAKKWG